MSDWVLYYVAAYAAGYCLLQLTLAALLLRRAPAAPRPGEWPRVDVLVAARDESANIDACLASLAAQDYPVDSIRFLVADDRSTDDTRARIAAWAARDARFQLVIIENDLPNLRGKQNVLAQLANLADAPYLLVTDADVTQPPGWAREHVASLASGADVTSGPTVVRPRGVFAGLQSMDWLIGILVIKALDAARLPITSVGNNMGVTRAAYDAVGRYEGLDFSVTEDFKLFAAILANGGRSAWLFGPQVLNLSEPIDTFRGLLRQRKRWFRGGSEGPWYARALFTYYALSAPMFVIAWLGHSPAAAFTAWGCCVGADLALSSAGCARLRYWKPLWYFPMFPPYRLMMSVIMPIYIALPGKVNWKGRQL